MAEKKKKVVLRNFDPVKRAAKNATVKERNKFRKEQRQKAAKERQAEWDKHSLEEKLAICKKSPFPRKREIARLEKQVTAKKNRSKK